MLCAEGASEDPPRWRCDLAVVAGCGNKWIDEAEDRLGGVGGVDEKAFLLFGSRQ